MTQKRIPARRSRPAGRRTGGERASGNPSSYRPKRVRAGGAPAKSRKRPSKEPSPLTGQPPLKAPLLSEKQRRHLRGLAHDLKPIIWLGNAGLTDGVATETARALQDHELIKVKGQGGDRESRDALFAQLADRTASVLIHRIGNVAVLYRPHASLPRILIPDNA